MRTDRKMMLLCLFIILSLGTILYIFGLNQRYKYICFNTDITKDTLIIADYLDVCTTNKKFSDEVITDKNTILSEDPYISYKLIKDIVKKGEMLYIEDFTLYEQERPAEEEINLLTELKVSSIKDSNGNVLQNDLIKYNIYIKNNKLYATNLNTGEIQLIFDKEEVVNIAVKPTCCTGEGYLLILTKTGNVYISENDCNYSFTFNYPFKSLEVTDIVGFKLISITDDMQKELYGIKNNGEEILLENK